VILKAAEEAPASALAVLQCLLDAGLPKEAGQAVFGIPDEVSRRLLASPVIRKLSFTGSTVVGKHLMKLAADDCKRTTMELGGHGAVLIFDDVDVEHVLNTMAASKFPQCRPGLRFADPLHREGRGVCAVPRRICPARQGTACRQWAR
jgi:succinate-semialdehyde dehydrogenase/glutarate-semialdehyde dehydrogenase